MLRARSALLVVCLGFPGSLVPTLIAHSARAADDAMLEMARERFQEGVKYYDEKQYEKARAAFLQAYALKRHPAVLLNLAQSELRSGHEADAAKHFSAYLREHKEASALEKQEADKGLAAAKVKVSEVAVSVDADGAEVYVDGQPEGRSPLASPVYLEPGTHSLEARKEGKTATASVTAKAGVTSNASLSFAGSTAGATPAAGVGAATAPESTSSQTPSSEPAQADTGEKKAEFDTGGKRESFPSWVAHNKVAWVGAGLTVAGLATGIVFAISAHSAYNTADTVAQKIRDQAASDRIDAPCLDPSRTSIMTGQDYVKACSTYQDDVDTGDSRKMFSTVGFIVAGVAAAGTVVYYFVDSGKSKPPEARTARPLRAAIAPVAAPTYQGLHIVGEF